MPYRLGLAALVVTSGCGSPSPATRDAPTGFELVADYTLDPGISARLGSASYVGGQTVHVDLTYPSFAADLTPSEWPVVQLASGETTANMTILPNCDDCPSPPYREHDEVTVIWTGGGEGGFLLQGGIYCQVPTGSCGGTLDGSAF
ncbi:MAG TPA: hypothetical protein VGG74_25765 [Kofleriaceae bacterium]|jgi:hypothetical protein